MELSACHLQSYRWGLLGNAVSVPVAQWIGQSLLTPYAQKYILGPSDAPLLPYHKGAAAVQLATHPIHLCQSTLTVMWNDHLIRLQGD